MKTLLTFWKNTAGLQIIIALILVVLISSCKKDEDSPPQRTDQSDENKITSFIFLIVNNPIEVNVIATIDNENKTITASVPSGTDITGLLPEIEVSPKAQINTELAQDFSNPISYVVTAENGTPATYVVTVIKELSQRDVLKAILDANPNHTIDWDLETTENLGDFTGVTTNTEGNIKELILDNKMLSELPPEIGQLMGLTKLSLFSNSLTELPMEIWGLTNLEFLEIGYNGLTSIPQEIVNLVNLERFTVYANELVFLPVEIGSLSHLKILGFSDNNITTLPSEIGQLTELTSLGATGNQLISLPAEIGKLINLQTLLIANNELASLPPEIGFLTELTQLVVYGNNFTVIPNSICFLEQFNGLFISKDPGVSCATLSITDALIQFYSANLDNTLGWGVNNYPGVTFNSLSNPIGITLNNKNLTRIPEDINVFGDLEVLNINSNNISSLPEISTNLFQLTVITAANNNLTTVPDGLGALTNLALLSITNNPISSIPQSVCDLQVSNGGILTILTDPGEGCQ